MTGASKAAVLAALLATAVQPVAAGPVPPRIRPPSRETRCNLGGWLASVRGTAAAIPVRAAPRAGARILGTLPNVAPSDDVYPVDFVIVGSRNGWLKITGASDAKNEDRARPTFAGTGWIDGASVRMGIQSGHGYARPDRRSARLVDLHGDWLTDRGWIVGIAGCSERWVLVDYRLYTPGNDLVRVPRHPYRAWFRGACAVSETTCDMSSVDRDVASEPGRDE